MGKISYAGSERMKLVIQNMARVWGGNEKFLVTLGQGLMMRGHEVVVSCPRGPVRERARAKGLRVTAQRPRGSVDLLSGAAFAAWLAKERPDALLLTSWHSISWASLAGRLVRVPRVVLRQGIVRQAPSKGVRAYALRHWIDEVITNAAEIRNLWLESLRSFPAGHVHVVLNTVTPARADRSALREKLRRELAVPDDTLIVGGAGIVTKRKNFDLLLRAFARAGVPGMWIVIVGDGIHLPRLEQLAAELGIQGSVRFLGRRDDAGDIIGGLDAFVLSSKNEGMANVMLEAMANGTPVIAADISGVRTAIGECGGRPPAGWIFPPDDEVELAQILSEVSHDLRNGARRAADMSREALWRTGNWFTLDRMLDECEHILFG